MSLLEVHSFSAGDWLAPSSQSREIHNAVTGELIAVAGNHQLNTDTLLEYGRTIGGPALRAMSFHDRARMIKALANHLNEHRQALYELSFATGATEKDHLIDIDGGIGTLFVLASKARREMPDSCIYIDGDVEQLSRSGQFMGQHVCTPLLGVAVHINAFNFPVWGMLEKLASTLLAGMPAIVKPATSTCYVTELAVRIMLDSAVLPEGAVQLVTGDLGNTLEKLDGQDVISFTGSAQTAMVLRSHPNIIKESVRFSAEQDSLNASILGPDAISGTAEFDLFLDEAHREITTKAGQKCTAIRRMLVPNESLDSAIVLLSQKLANTITGDPRHSDTHMGALVSLEQRNDVVEKTALIAQDAERIFGDPDNFRLHHADREKGAFLPPMLFHCTDPDNATHIHDTEAFGPVASIMGYRDIEHAISLVNRGKGSLVASIFTHDATVATQVVTGCAAFHGRLYFNNRDSMSESTGHGSPLPHMTHGGPGRAGGGEELGGVRGVMHYMQRTAIQGSPDFLTAIGSSWVPGSKQLSTNAHPFTLYFEALNIGDTIMTDAREISLHDIEHFAQFTGDTFYAHMDEEAARRNPFFPGRVAHGYLLLSFAAGLFVEPAEGPVLANTGLDNLRFTKPVQAGDSIHVQLTVQGKKPRSVDYGEVRWSVTVFNQNDESVAQYQLLTMNACK